MAACVNVCFFDTARSRGRGSVDGVEGNSCAYYTAGGSNSRRAQGVVRGIIGDARTARIARVVGSRELVVGGHGWVPSVSCVVVGRGGRRVAGGSPRASSGQKLANRASISISTRRRTAEKPQERVLFQLTRRLQAVTNQGALLDIYIYNLYIIYVYEYI